MSPFGIRLLQWGGLFLTLLVSIYAATQNQQAPLLILFAAFYMILANFSIPIAPTLIGFVPIFSATSLLLLGWQPAVLALVMGLLLAELSAPLWEPLWQNIPEYPQQRGRRLSLHAVTILTMIVMGMWGEWFGRPWNNLLNELPRELAGLTAFAPWRLLLTFSSLYFLVYATGHLLAARLMGQRWTNLVDQLIPRLVGYVLLLQPLAWLGGFIYRELGLPAFLLGSVVMLGLCLQLWFAWQNRYSLHRRMTQIASLNRISGQLRESLDLDEVLIRTYEQVGSVLPLDRFSLILRDEQGGFTRPLLVIGGEVQREVERGMVLDDFSRWVIEKGRPLEVDGGTLFYASQHQLEPPQPYPSLWLGYPLQQGNEVTGVMVIHQTTTGRIVDSWSRELLVAIARQASDAIVNARQHRETLRLYSLTDEALTRRAQQLQAILNSTQEGFLMLGVDGRVMLANSVAEEYLSLLKAQEGDIFSTQTAIVNLGYSAGQLTSLLEGLKRGEIPVVEPKIIPVEDGDGEAAAAVRYIERVESPVWGAENQLLGWLIVMRDVTEQQERVEWRTQFTNMVVHDLRNPLTTLLTGFSRLEQTEAEETEDIVQAIAQGGHRVTLNMLDMVDSLMDIARMEAGQIVADAEAMRLPALIGRVVVDMLPLAFAKEVELSFSYPDGLPAVWADEELLRRVLVNLLDNALKFTPAGGRINGFLGEEPAANGLDEPGIRCTLIDNGPGIPEPARDKIFERFVRIDPGGGQVRGTGVGLAFCKMAIEAQGGKIWVEDVPEEGGCFIFTLPGIPNFSGMDQS